MSLKWSKMSDSEKQNLSEIVISLVLMLGGHFLPLTSWIRIIYYLIIYVIIGRKIVVKAIKNIFNGEVFDENFLMVVATVGAFAVKQYPEAVAVMLFYQIGELFQRLALESSRRSIAGLVDMRPDYANLEINGNVQRIKPDKVKVGDTIVVRPGEKVPLDGTVAAGATYLNTAALTGETKPVYVKEGDEVLSGTIVKDGVIRIEVAKEFGESTVSQVLDLVEHASENKTVTENFITRFAKIYTPAVVGFAVLLAIIPPLVGAGAFKVWLYRALIFLVISCPCALVISIPLGFFGGIGAASKAGALIKGSNFLEALTQVKTIVYDKTGTLTRGEFAVVANYPAEGRTTADVLKLAALAESASPHPIAKSIVAEAGKDLDMSRLSDSEELVGMGVSAVYKDKLLYAGKKELLAEHGIQVNNIKAPDGTVVFVGYDGQYIGALIVADVLKPDAADTIVKLRQMGITRQVMLTGDNARVGNAVAQKLDLDDVRASCLPQDKLTELEKLKNLEHRTGGKVTFVGDGLNDTPVLAAADVGISMGALGSDAAIAASDIVLMHDDPSTIVSTLKIARRTKRIVWENIVMALGFKLIFLILATIGMATMWEAVFADVGVTILAILNALRLLHEKHASEPSKPKRNDAAEAGDLNLELKNNQ